MNSLPSFDHLRLLFTDSPRSPHLYRIWQSLAACRELPQVDRWLAQYFRGEKRFGKKDRQWYADAIFAAFRFGPMAVLLQRVYPSLDHELLTNTALQLGGASSLWPDLSAVPAEDLFLWLSLYLDEEAIGPQRHPEKAAFMRAIEQQVKASASLRLLWLGIPNSYERALQKRQELSQWTDQQRDQFLQWQTKKASLWLRVNQPNQAEAAREECQEAGMAFTEFGEAWQVEYSKNLQTLDCLNQGVLEIQDKASQHIGNALELEGEPLVWDCCAGGGGKTLQIASRLQGRGMVYASDVRSYKLAEVERRAQRAGFSKVKALPWNGENLPQFPREWTQRGGVDCILIDAPCTGTGTWRRSPDAKYRSSELVIKNLQTLQLSLFAKVLPALRAGGQLVYATCSWLPDENEVIVAAALEKHPELKLESMQLCGNPLEDADSMFYAVLRKKL